MYSQSAGLQRQKNINIFQTKKKNLNCKNKTKMYKSMPMLAIRFFTRSINLQPFGRSQQLRQLEPMDMATIRFSEN